MFPWLHACFGWFLVETLLNVTILLCPGTIFVLFSVHNCSVLDVWNGLLFCPAGSHSAKHTEFITQKRKKLQKLWCATTSPPFSSLPVEPVNILQLCPLSCPYSTLAFPPHAARCHFALLLQCSLSKASVICWADMLWSASSSSIFNPNFVFSLSSPKEE